MGADTPLTPLKDPLQELCNLAAELGVFIAERNLIEGPASRHAVARPEQG